MNYVWKVAKRFPNVFFEHATGYKRDVNVSTYNIRFSLASLAVVAWFLARTHAGLIMRAVGDQHDAAHVLGYKVIRIRYLAVLFGGAMAGIAGAYMSLAYTPLWAQDMIAGRGWVALALVT